MIALLRTRKVENKLALSAGVRGAVIHGNSEELKVYKENEWLIRQVLHIDSLEYKIGEKDAELIK